MLKAAITIDRPVEEVRRQWETSPHRPQGLEEGTVTFRPAPGDRGTEIHVDLQGDQRGGRVGEVVAKVTGMLPLAKVKDALRHFKQVVETGEIPRSEGTPEGESVGRKFKQRPAQPLDHSEHEEVATR